MKRSTESYPMVDNNSVRLALKLVHHQHSEVPFIDTLESGHDENNIDEEEALFNAGISNIEDF